MTRNDPRKLAALTLALALLLIPATLLAQRGGGFRHRGGPMGDTSPIDRLDERLDLTDTQREAIEAIFDGYRENLELQRQALREAHRALAEAAHAEVLDEDAVRALGQELGAAQAEHAITRSRMHREIRQQLTPEQQELFDQRGPFGPRGRGFGPRGGRGFGPGGGGFGPGGGGFGPGGGPAPLDG